MFQSAEKKNYRTSQGILLGLHLEEHKYNRVLAAVLQKTIQ